MYTSIKHIIEESIKCHSSFLAFSLKIGFRTQTYTYHEVGELLKKLPTFFRENNIKNGDKIIIFSLNKPEYALLVFGAFLCGVIIVPIDYRTNKETIEKFVAKVEPQMIFASYLFKDLFKSFKRKLFVLEDLIPNLEKISVTELPEIDHSKLAAILFTSGTTGEPKGTMITCENIVASINNIIQVFTLPKNFRVLSILPLSHVLEMFGGLLTTFSLGCHIHYIERINTITIVQAFRRYKIQGMAVVPQMLRLLLQNVERKLKEDKKEHSWDKAQKISPFLPNRLRRILFSQFHQGLGGSFSLFVSGSAPLETKLAQVWENTGITVLEGYGASETTGFVSANTLKNNKLGTCGKILPGITVKQAEDGELLVSGKNIVSGYFQNPDKTEESFQDGWFKTGDIVSINNGYLKIVGREKFKIVLPDGKKVYPEDVEKKLNEHPQVNDCVVFGLDSGQGEVVHAEVITKGKHDLEKIILEVNQSLNPHEQIQDYSVWEKEDFPRTKTLKVDREAVKNEVLQRKNNEEPENTEEQAKQDKLIEILSQVSGKAKSQIKSKDNLVTALKMDSLKRIELLALIEEELGVSIDELKINPKTDVSELRKLVQEGKPVVLDDGEKLNDWQFTNFMGKTRAKLQDSLVFPLFNIGIKIRCKNVENISKIKTPSLFIFNHVGVYDIVNILRVLPKNIREKTAIAATSELWHQEAYRSVFSTTFGNAFPFVKAESHNAMRGNFDRVGQLLDMGYNIMISPEGNITHTGELLPFHTGAGYIAVEMGVPVVPFKINGYYELWPEETSRKLNLFWPKEFGTVEMIVGEPITFDPTTPYEEATQILRRVVSDLKG